MMAAGGPHYDLARFGMEVFRASPRQADLMIVAGRVSQKMAPVLRTIYDQMVEPKWVISMGVCASSGGMFNNYALVQGVDTVVPVDVYAPGCPPGPETLMHAIVTLHGLIDSGEILRRREANGGGPRSQRRGSRHHLAGRLEGAPAELPVERYGPPAADAADRSPTRRLIADDTARRGRDPPADRRTSRRSTRTRAAPRRSASTARGGQVTVHPAP